MRALTNYLEEKFQLTRLMRGVTIVRVDPVAVAAEFQLTRLMRGVTSFLDNELAADIFQLTRLMRGVTIVPSSFTVNIPYFNSHASCEA